MYKKLLLLAFAATFFAGCASVPMESSEMSDTAKQYNPPSSGNAGLYIYRAGSFGGALKKDVCIDGKCIGETAPNIFFYEEVSAGEDHTLATESEFSPNDLIVKTNEGEHYFVRQFIKMGLFVGGVGMELVDEEKGKKDVAGLKMAKKGKCSK